MALGEDKGANQQVKIGNLIKNTEDLKMNNLNIKPIKIAAYTNVSVYKKISAMQEL